MTTSGPAPTEIPAARLLHHAQGHDPMPPVPAARARLVTGAPAGDR
jgi:hypothetical protein